MANKKVLVVAPHPATHFGFARISQPIIDILIDKFQHTKDDLVICDTSKLQGLPLEYRGIPVLSMTSGGTVSQLLPTAVTEFKPKLVICFGDIWDHFMIYNLKKTLGFDLMYYANVESEYIPSKLITADGPLMFHEEYSKIDHLIAYSRFGATELAKVVKKEVPYIYHFVDDKAFYKIPDFDRQTIFKGVPPDAFIVSTVAVNGFRKSLDMICASFAEMLKKLPAEARAKTYLYLHTNMTGTVGWDLKELTDMFDISGNVLLNHGISKYGSFVSDEELNKIYNATDVFINLSRGEGFGLGLIEACSAGCRIVFLDYATPSEIMQDEDGRVPVALREVRPSNVTNFSALPDPRVAGEKLANLRQQKSKAALRYNRIASENMTLAQRFGKAKIMDEWLKILTPVIEKEPPKVSITLNKV